MGALEKHAKEETEMRNRVRTGLLTLLWSLCCGNPAIAPAAAPTEASGIEVKAAWARATVPGQAVAGVYLQIRSTSKAEITGVRTPDAKRAELHSMSSEGGVMRMRQLEKLELPAGQTVTLEPNGIHIMLLDPHRQLKPGDKVKLTLLVRQGGKQVSLPVVAEVRKIE
jgi:copper(I)-binding protein